MLSRAGRAADSSQEDPVPKICISPVCLWAEIEEEKDFEAFLISTTKTIRSGQCQALRARRYDHNLPSHASARRRCERCQEPESECNFRSWIHVVMYRVHRKRKHLPLASGLCTRCSRPSLKRQATASSPSLTSRLTVCKYKLNVSNPETHLPRSSGLYACSQTWSVPTA